MLNFIANYKDASGNDYHNVMQAFTHQGMLIPAANGINTELKSKGYTLHALAYVPGDFTMPELERMSDVGPMSKGAVLLYMTDAFARECLEEQKASR